jgi:hypothetical protein
MAEVIVIAEGVTEEAFIKQLVAPALRTLQVFVKPVMLNTSKDAKGGAVSYDRLQRNVRNISRQYPRAVVTTLLDLYALPSNFPGFAEAQKLQDVYQRVNALEAAFHQAIVADVGCRGEQFLPHIQPYEFEGLLFSDVVELCNTEAAWLGSLAALSRVRDAAESPEHINDSFDTKPSKRLESLLRQPGYRKTLHGPKAAERITLAVMERECVHFGGWMNRLRGLRA